MPGPTPMVLQHFDIDTLAASPWKNGGGITREIVCSPAGAGMDHFDWRVSIATVERPGLFSAFAGVDRVIMLLEGAGMRLHSPDGGIDHRLDMRQVPYAFPGDAALMCEPLNGPSTDFNVMARRGCLRPEVRVLHASGTVAPARQGLLLALSGRWQVGEFTCEPGAGLWWDGSVQSWRVNSPDAGAALVAVRLEPASPIAK